MTHSGTTISSLVSLVEKVEFVDRLTYMTYAYNRKTFPDTLPQRWALLFSNAAELERRYQEEIKP